MEEYKHVEYYIRNKYNHGSIQFSCFFRPLPMIGRPSENHCPLCISENCPDYILYKKNKRQNKIKVDSEIDLNINVVSEVDSEIDSEIDLNINIDI